MTEGEWQSQVSLWGMSPVPYLRGSHRKFFLFLAAYLPRTVFGRMCRACEASLPLFEKEAEGDATIDLWRGVMTAEHIGPQAGSGCPTQQLFKHAVNYFRGVLDPGEFWNQLYNTSADIEHQIRQQYMADHPGEWVGPFRAKMGDIWQDGMRYLKEVLGNPFRPVSVDPAWLTSDVVALAWGIYAKRTFELLPILGDALQDAGCENADILTHLRGPGPHVRGCWALDLVLGKG